MDIDTKERKKKIKDLSKSVKDVLAKKIEQAVYNFSKDYSISNETPFLFEQIYMTKISELVEQLKKSKKLVKNVLDKNVITKLISSNNFENKVAHFAHFCSQNVQSVHGNIIFLGNILGNTYKTNFKTNINDNTYL